MNTQMPQIAVHHKVINILVWSVRSRSDAGRYQSVTIIIQTNMAAKTTAKPASPRLESIPFIHIKAKRSI